MRGGGMRQAGGGGAAPAIRDPTLAPLARTACSSRSSLPSLRDCAVNIDTTRQNLVPSYINKARMTRSKGGMASPRSLPLLLAGLSLIAICNAGPLGPLPNVTSSDLGLKEGSCAVGDVVYMPGDEFPGSTPCEKCGCAGGEVSCKRQRCESRPGCKALHRPDQCCPTYQCECEQEGRVYGNGEKLVDPADPCRVCYCQGGEVVCRRIACFLRDDCEPRLVPGRCCPEYDNCPLRGVTAVPGVTVTTSSPIIEPSGIPLAPKEAIKQEITIKEITPVSEIPIITDVKIKEILPSPSIEVSEYSSSKSPLIPREATSEKSSGNPELTERPVIIEILPSSSPVFPPSSPEIVASSSEISETKSTNDLTPSKISLSTQDSINSEIYASDMPNVGTVGSPSVIQEVIHVATTTKSPVVLEEEDTSFFEHNPAFPPIPDDLSVLSNHDDEISSDSNIEGDHIPMNPDVVSIASTTTEAPIVSESHSTMLKDVTETTTTIISSTELITEYTTKLEELATTVSNPKQSPMLNLRSAIPTEILNVPSSVSEDITGELDETETSTSTAPLVTITTTENIKRKYDDTSRANATSFSSNASEYPNIPGIRILEVTTPEDFSTSNTKIEDEQTFSTAKSSSATEITAQTEFSSLPIETSDQNPHEEAAKDKSATSSAESTVVEIDPTKILPIESEVITVSRSTPNTENKSVEHVETTEFVLTSFGSSESATDAVELIKITPEGGKSAAIIESGQSKKSNVLADLINLVGDVASISDHTDAPSVPRHVTSAQSISDSEELIPVNAGYKSKNSNWNLNSITEIVPKSKNPINKQKVIEIEDDESDGITDSPPPNDKVEPTTRRPIIDNVSDDKPENKTDKKDIEIIGQSFVPGVNRRPTKVVMKKNHEKPVAADDSDEEELFSASAEATTDSKVSVSSEINTQAPPEIRIVKSADEDRSITSSSSTVQ